MIHHQLRQRLALALALTLMLGVVVPAQASPASQATTVFFDDFETDQGWVRNPNGTDTATTGLWERGDPETTTSSGTKQQGTTVSGANDLVTGRLAGASVGANDIDGGTTSIQSPAITLPSSGNLTLSFFFYFAHLNNSSNADFFRVSVVGATTTQVFQELGAATDDDAAFVSQSVSLNSFAGQTVRIRIEAADAGSASLVEAAVDDVRITSDAGGPTPTPTPTPTATPTPTPTPSPSGLVRVSDDPYTATNAQHRTQVEADTFAAGNTIVSAFQTARISGGGANNIGWATSQDAGATWTNGFLPGTTNVVGGPYSAISDPVVAFDARHNTWLLSTLGIASGGNAVLTSRSTDGGLTWGNPIVVDPATSGNDKNWIVCDNTSTSPFYGNCYTVWDDNSLGNRILASRSTDGGLTWSTPIATANNGTGLGVQPVVLPNGTVVVPSGNANLTSIIVFRSTNGGVSWTSTATVTSIQKHTVAGGVRAPSLPSAEIDAAGRVYIVWQDCRFISGCTANDIVMTTTTDGISFTAVTRIPIDPTNSGVDHFIPGIGVDRTTSGGSARIGLFFHYYANTSCTASTCQLFVGYVSSANGGASWSAKEPIAGPMSLGWLANTSQGRMFGDYVSTSIVNGRAHSVFAVAAAPSGTTFNEAMHAVVGGKAIGGGSLLAAAEEGVSVLEAFTLDGSQVQGEAIYLEGPEVPPGK